VLDVAVVGSVNLDLVATTPRLPRPGETVSGTAYAEHAGGKGLNQAIAAARSGASVSMVGAVGDDEAGTRLRSIAEHEGIDVGAIASVSGAPTGRALISVDWAGENSIVVIPGANALIRSGAIPPARVVIAQLEIPMVVVIEAFRSARDADALTILNPAPGQPLPDELIGLCDVIVPNEHELLLIGGLDALFDHGVRAVVTTRGAEGVVVATRDDGVTTERHHGAFPVTPIDTTGAGDAFCGALAARLAGGDSLESAVCYAAAAGALATTIEGAVPSLPRAVDVQHLLDSSER
jgi:ribokinase